ncbi:MAG: tetratricopeptide repeat protein [Methylacidiphilales bacterium]|nr:tetratricopeptide repeat protein [Candidatus Methylacidiphilales bacterium]
MAQGANEKKHENLPEAAQPTRDDAELIYVSRLITAYWRPVLLVAMILLAYQPVWKAGFVWDDDLHLTQNPCIIGPLGFANIWTSGNADYFPLTLTTLWVGHALWGLDPLPFHLLDVLMHAAGAILLWRVLLRLAVPGAWLGAALWALHPVQVESAAWVCELKNTQSGVFYLLAILFFLKWLDAGVAPDGRRNIRREYVLMLVFAVLAVLSKTSTVMLPVVLGLCWWWREKGWRPANVLWLMPLFLFSLAASGWTVWEQRFHSHAAGAEWNQGWPERIAIAGNAVWFYLGKLIWPHPLIFIYPRWQIDTAQLLSYLPAAAVLAVLLFLWWNRKGELRPVFFVAAYFVISLFPVLGFFNLYFFRFSFVADHFQYLACMGPLALAGAGLAVALDFFERKSPGLKPALCAGLLLVLGGLTWSQCHMFRDLETLWRTTIARNPGCAMVHYNLGVLLMPSGRTLEAEEQYRQAFTIKPDYAEAHYNLGVLLMQGGRTLEAEDQYRQALAIKPDYAEAYNNLGLLRMQSGRVPEAIEQYQLSLKINPYNAAAHVNLGNALLQTDRLPEAREQYEQALKINPLDSAAHYDLGSVLQQTGHIPEAEEQYEQALKIRPDFPEARAKLAGLRPM